MATSHPFNFDGGEELSHMGATWFVSYAYFCYIDRKHFNWTNIKTVDSRKSIYETTKQYHKFWLSQILLMEESRLNTNKIGISAVEIKKMAKQVLAKIRYNVTNENLEVKNRNMNTREKTDERIENLNLVGEKVINKNEDIFTVISIDCSNAYIVKLNDGKNGYDLKIAVPKKTLRFLNESVQAEVEKHLEKIKGNKPLDANIKQRENKEERLIKEAVKLFKGNGTSRVMSCSYATDFSSLEFGKIYGNKALYIYDMCCAVLNFHPSKRENFQRRRILFAQNATPDGYAVWMLPHNNYTGDASSCWANIIEGDVIYEAWNIHETGVINDTRVTFAKQGNGEYVFMGVYKFESVKEISKVIEGVYIKKIKTYKRILGNYQKLKRKIYYN